MRGIEARPRRDQVAIAGDRLGDETIERRRLEKAPPLARDFLAEREMLVGAGLAHRGDGRRARRRIAEIIGESGRLGRRLRAAGGQQQGNPARQNSTQHPAALDILCGESKALMARLRGMQASFRTAVPAKSTRGGRTCRERR
jgi:hypothetical protein